MATPPDDPRPAKGRLTPLGRALIGAIPVLAAIMVIARRGAVADLAFLGLALIALALATAVLGPPRRPRRPRHRFGLERPGPPPDADRERDAV